MSNKKSSKEIHSKCLKFIQRLSTYSITYLNLSPKSHCNIAKLSKAVISLRVEFYGCQICLMNILTFRVNLKF